MTDSSELLKMIFGRLTLESLPFHDPDLVVTFSIVALGRAIVICAIT